jgi:hypothetical protein
MLLLHGGELKELFSGQSLLVNTLGWSLIGVLLGALYPRASED